MSTLVTNS